MVLTPHPEIKMIPCEQDRAVNKMLAFVCIEGKLLSTMLPLGRKGQRCAIAIGVVLVECGVIKKSIAARKLAAVCFMNDMCK